MLRRTIPPVTIASFVLALVVWVIPAAAQGPPTGERDHGGGKGGQVIEAMYGGADGSIVYISTPKKTPDPVKSSPKASAPIYLPVYPKGTDFSGLLCEHLDASGAVSDNCPDHGFAIAGLAAGFEPGVYGAGVQGHDHVGGAPGDASIKGTDTDFNVAWVPVVVLFTDPSYVTHLTTVAQIDQYYKDKKVIEIPLDGNHYGLPNLTFHCAVVSSAVWDRSTPVPAASEPPATG